MTEVNCAEKRGPLGDRRIIYAILRVQSFDEVSWIPHHSVQISRRHVARDSLPYFEDDKVVIYIFARPRRVAISLQSNWSGIKFNVSKYNES